MLNKVPGNEQSYPLPIEIMSWSEYK